MRGKVDEDFQVFLAKLGLPPVGRSFSPGIGRKNDRGLFAIRWAKWLVSALAPLIKGVRAHSG